MSLHLLDAGRGPPILLLHGLGGEHTVWNGLLPVLTKEFRVLAPDLRGHGRSKASAELPFTFPDLEADLVALLDSLGLAKTHLVGLSAGAFLALQFALDHPERCESLVSIAGGMQCDNHTRAIGDRWIETFRSEGLDAYVLRLVKDLYYPDWSEEHLEIVDHVRERAIETEYGAVKRWSDAIRTFDQRGRVGRLRLPTLVIHGMDDAVVDVAHARLLRQSIPGAELKLFARTGHLPPVERPEETAEAIAAFVRKVEAARTGPAS